MVCSPRGSTPRLAIEVIMNFRQRIQDIIPSDDALSIAASIAAEADAEIERLQRVIADRDKIADRLSEKRREAEEAAEKAKVMARRQRDERMATLVKLREAMQEIERKRFPR